MNIVEALASLDSTELTITALRSEVRHLHKTVTEQDAFIDEALETIVDQGTTIYALRAELAALKAAK